MSITSVLIGLQFVLFLWLFAISIFAYKFFQTYKALTKGIDSADVAKILKQLKADQSLNHAQIDKLFEALDNLKTDLRPFVQKIGFVRYNPFGNTGGDQSFSVCFLDGRGDGILLTSLHARQQTRIYTKEIISNQPKDQTELSKEEKKCLQQAVAWSKQ